MYLSRKNSQTVEGMLSAVSLVRDSLGAKRDTEHFQTIFWEAEDRCDNLPLQHIVLPHRPTHRPPKRYSGQATAYTSESALDFYRTVLDTVDTQMSDRFMQQGIEMIKQLENILLTDITNDAVRKYPELNEENLKVQIAMFKNKYNIKTTADAMQALKEMGPEVRSLFDQAETLGRLLLVVPISSAEAERSFSGLRRLKTWLRSTMSQKRPNGVAV